ncbi:hypothetical protein [Methylogaea oryzae]|uniref:hypothetical protein n=1 Tax=Methylogaea oryzae TaxID=1295382 RepID=UPI0006D080E6|nr:hypothetical protein [Methylogaea oryzae]
MAEAAWPCGAQSAALLLLAAGVLAVLLLESTPLLDPARKLTHDEMVEARSVLDFGIRSARHLGVTNTVSLSNGELDATVNYLLQQFVTGVGHFRLEREASPSSPPRGSPACQ